MGHTNSTANLALPQFIGTDKPTWLSDVNGAFSAIDAYAGTNDAALAITDAKADTAVNDAASAVTTATNAANTAGTASTQATNAVTVAGNALTVANGINSKVGVLTDLHTTDKSTVVNAINEVKDAEGDLSSLTTSDKTNLVAAINEVAQGGGGGGQSVSVTADGTQTVSQLLDALYALIDGSAITAKAVLVINGVDYHSLVGIDPSYYEFSKCRGVNTHSDIFTVNVKTSGSTWIRIRSTVSDNSVSYFAQESTQPSAGYKIELFY